ncbi:MAG TPA: MFS transporter [Acidimicrobiales bacterium]
MSDDDAAVGPNRLSGVVDAVPGELGEPDPVLTEPNALGRIARSFDALRVRPFRRVWGANFVSFAGNWLQITARAVLIYDLTGSTAALGFVYFLSYLPQLVLSTPAGVLADRLDRRHLLIVGHAVMGSLSLAMGFLAATGSANVWNVGAVSVLVGVVQTITMPTMQAVVPSLVPSERLSSAVSLNAATVAATRVIGPMIAGVLIPFVGVSWLFFGNAICYLPVILVWVITALPAQVPLARTRMVEAVVEAVGYVRRTGTLKVALLVTFVIVGLGSIYQPLAVAFCTGVLADGDHDLGATYYGMFQSALGIGSFIGIMGVTDLASRRTARAVTVSALGFAVSLGLLALTDVPTLAIVIAGAVGLFQFCTNALCLTVLQHHAPEGMEGRILSLYTLAFVGTMPILGLVGGQIAEAIGTAQTFFAVAVGALLFTVALALHWSRFLPQGDAAIAPGDSSTA